MNAPVQHHSSALSKHLLNKLIGELVTAHLKETGIILDPRRMGYLTAEGVFFNYENTLFGAFAWQEWCQNVPRELLQQ